MSKTVLFIGAPKESIEAMRIAKRAGYRVFAADADPSAPGAAEAEAFFPASCYHVDDVLRVIPPDPRSAEIDGILMVGVDAPLVMARLAGALGLPGQRPETAALASHKLRMKEALRAGGVPIPDFWPLPDEAALRARLAADPGFYVIKPTDSRGARGVLKIGPDSDLAWAFAHAKSQSPSGEVMLERWLSGEQYSTESVVWQGRHVLCGTARREYASTRQYEPYLVENGGETPAPISAEQEERLAEVLDAAARALGLESGTLKGDLVWHDDGPAVIEVATRLSGGYFCTYNIPVSFGVPIIEWALSIAVGEEPDWSRAQRPARPVFTANRKLFLDEPGRVRTVALRDEALPAEPWVQTFMVYVKPGSVRRGVTNHTDDLAHALSSGESYEEAVARAERLIDNLVVELDPLEE